MFPREEEEAGPSRGEVEAQRDPEAGGGPEGGELGERVCSSEWSDILLKEASPGNPQLPASCRPPWPTPTLHRTYRLGGQQDCVLGEGGGQSRLRLTVRMACGVSLFALCQLL